MEISIRDIGMVYPPNKTALEQVSLDITSPSMLGLVGPNGAGKTTLMKLLVAALTPTTGEITLDGWPLAEKEQTLKRALGYLPQSFGLYDELSVRQFLDYMAALKGIKNPKEAIEKAIAETHLAEKRNAKIKTLSGGQRQRVGIAQALLGDPALLVLDEPTVGLDPEERIQFRNLFSQAARNRIVLLSTHIIEDVQSICNRLIVLSGGRIRFDGAPEALIRAAQGHVGVFEAGDETADALEYHITARVNTARGVSCRIVAGALPPFAQPAEPTLEDAYMYLLECGGTP